MTVDQIMDTWRVSEEQREQLLSQPGATHKLVAIHDALNRIFSGAPTRADAWISKPNAAFAGRSALDLMLSGDIDHVSQYLRHHLYNA